MPTFAFEGVDAKGQKVKKEIDAVDKDDALSKIRDLGDLGVFCSPEKVHWWRFF